MNTPGEIIAGYSKPFRWVKPIKDYEIIDGGKAFITETDNSNHIISGDDIVLFDTDNNIETLAGTYFKVPNSCLHYVAR